MAWQRIFGSMGDDVSNKTVTTSSRRGIAERIWFEVESFLKDSIKVEVTTNSHVKRKDTYSIKERLAKYTELGNEKKIQLWTKNLEEANQFNQEADDKDYIETNIRLPQDKRFKLCISGRYVDLESIRLANLIHNKQYARFFKELEKKGVDVQKELDLSLAEVI